MNPLSVYVHVPFCTIKCGYCDFNAYAGMGALQDRYFEAMAREIDASREILEDREIATVAFGGGTPGESPPRLIAATLDALQSVAPLATGAEVSLEANPGTTTGQDLVHLREAGVSRISFGAQTFDSEELRFLDRIHSPDAVAASVHLARDAGFNDINLDLMYAIPGQSMDSWERSLNAALILETDHMSTYALTVEEGTPLARRVERGEILPVDADTAADMYERATDILIGVGFRQYEISNWARPGHESRHNVVYWKSGDYLGLGAGAHGYIGGERYENVAHPRAYIDAVLGADRPRRAASRAYVPDTATAIFDWVTLKLRLLDGFNPSEFEGHFGCPLDAVAGSVLRTAEKAGLVEYGERLRLTRRGRLLHGEIAAELLAHLDGLKKSAEWSGGRTPC